MSAPTCTICGEEMTRVRAFALSKHGRKRTRERVLNVAPTFSPAEDIGAHQTRYLSRWKFGTPRGQRVRGRALPNRELGMHGGHGKVVVTDEWECSSLSQNSCDAHEAHDNAEEARAETAHLPYFLARKREQLRSKKR